MDKQQEMIEAAERAGLIFDCNGVHERQHRADERIQLYFMPDGKFKWTVLIDRKVLDIHFWDETHHRAVKKISDVIISCMTPSPVDAVPKCTPDDLSAEIDRLDARVVELEERVALYEGLNREQAQVIVMMGSPGESKEVARLNKIIKDIRACVEGV